MIKFICEFNNLTHLEVEKTLMFYDIQLAAWMIN